MAYFFDSYAIIEILNGNLPYLKFKEVKVVTGILNIGEVYHGMLKKNGKEAADNWFNNFHFELVEITPDVMVQSVYFRHINRKNDISLADSVGYKLSLKHNLKFLTGDRQFENMPNVEFVK